MSKKYISLIIFVVFIGGAAFGYFVSTLAVIRHFHHAMERGSTEMADHMIKKLTHELDLSEDQKKDVSEIVYRMHNNIEQIHTREFPDLKATFEKAHEEILLKLSPIQRDKFNEIHKEFMQHLEQRHLGPQ